MAGRGAEGEGEWTKAVMAEIAAATTITAATATIAAATTTTITATAGTSATVELGTFEIAGTTSTAAALMAAAAAAKQHHWHRLAAIRNSPGTPCCRARSSAQIGTGMWPSGRP